MYDLVAKAINVLGGDLYSSQFINVELYPRAELWLECVSAIYGVDWETVKRWIDEDGYFPAFNGEWIEKKMKEDKNARDND